MRIGLRPSIKTEDPVIGVIAAVPPYPPFERVDHTEWQLHATQRLSFDGVFLLGYNRSPVHRHIGLVEMYSGDTLSVTGKK